MDVRTHFGFFLLPVFFIVLSLFDIKKTSNEWTSERDGIIVETGWGIPSDEADPLTQITLTTVTMKINTGDEEFEIKNIMPQKSYLAQELFALIKLSGLFEFAGWYGDFDIKRPLDKSRESWRMNIVLRKKYINR